MLKTFYHTLGYSHVNDIKFELILPHWYYQRFSVSSFCKELIKISYLSLSINGVCNTINSWGVSGVRTCGCANAASASISPVSGLYSSPALYCSSSSSSPRYRKMPKVLDEDNEPFKQKHLRLKKQNQCMYYISLADPSPPPPGGSKFFQVHAVIGKIWQNRMLATP